MTKTSRTTDTRLALVHAARRVIRRDGAPALTLDAVAREAGVSKGGLLYHFPGKRDLIVGLVEAYVGEFEARVARRMEGGERFARAFVAATLAELGDADLKHANTALLAALAHEPDVLSRFREAAETWQARLEADGLDPVRATVARLAAEGLYFAELFGLAPPRGAVRAGVEALLLDLSDSHPDAPDAQKEA